MAVWIVRGGHYEEDSLEKGLISIGFGLDEDLKGILSREDLQRRIQQNNVTLTPSQVANWAGQVWRFKEKIQVGDLLLMPRKGQPTVAIGRVAGEYVYVPERKDLNQGRQVDWINREVSRDLIDPDLKASLSGHATVFQPKPMDAEERLLLLPSKTRRVLPTNHPPTMTKPLISQSIW